MMLTRNRLGLFRKVATHAAIVCSMVLCSGQQEARAQDSGQQEARAQDDVQDLQGIVPDYVPNGLSEGDFNQLDGNWAEWANETGRLVTDFYTSNDNSIRGRRDLLNQIQSRLKTMDRALSDSRYLSLYGPLADLNGRLSRRIVVASALLATVQQDVTQPSQSRLNSTMNKLAGETRALRSHLQSIQGGGLWIDYLQLDQIGTAAEQGDASQQAASLVSSVRQKLANRETFNDEQQQFLSRQPVQRFENALDRVTVLLNVDNPQDRQQELRGLAATLMEAIEEYSEEPTTENTQQLRNSYDDIRRLAPDGGAALTAAMRKHFLNYNFRVLVDESLVQDVVRDTQMTSGFINEMVSNARVTGCQWTNATVNMDLKPNSQGIRFDLLLNGNVRSSATGSTNLATVYTSGQFYFQGQKQVVFDGDRFTLWPAAVSVGGGNTPYAANTRFNWIPIIRRIARNAALREAGSPENSQYARNKVYQQAKSQFDSETSQMLWEAEQNLANDLAGPLRAGGYYPSVKRLHSTESEAVLRSRLMEAGEVGGGEVLPLPIYPAHGALVQLHESLLSQIGDRLDLEGKRFTPEELKQYLENEISQITGKPTDLGTLTDANANSDSPQVEEIIFHESDAVRFRVTGGEVILSLSLGLKLEDRDEIEPQRITVPLQFSLTGNSIHMERGTVGVSPIGRVEARDRTQQITRAGVMRQKIQEAFEPQDFDSSFDLSIQEKTLRLQVTDLRARSGWLSVIATDGLSGVQSPGGTMRSQPMQQARLPNTPQAR